MKKRPMKRVDKRLEEKIDAFWNKNINPITGWPDYKKNRKINSLRKIL